MANTTSSVTPITTEAEFEQATATGFVVADFYADWCPPCKMLAPELEKVAAAAPEGVRVIKINVDQLGSLAGRYAVSSIPTLIYFKDGEPYHRGAGYQPAAAIDAEIARLTA